MSPTPPSPPLVSPLSPSPSHSGAFSPLQYKQRSPATEETALQTRRQQRREREQQRLQNPVSPLHSDSPTQGHFSPISIIPPSSAPTRLYTTTPTTRQEVPLARGGTLHLQDHIPFKPAHTTNTRPTAAPPNKEASPTRPVSLYLADHHPHRLARAGDGNDDGDVEMASEAEWLRNRQDVVWEGGPEYERKRRRQKWTVGLVSLVSLVGLGIMLAWLVRWSDRDVVKGN